MRNEIIFTAMIEWLFAFLIFYLLYKLIFDFILPVSRASSQIKSRMNQMNPSNNKIIIIHLKQILRLQQTKSRPPADEYIDYEEIK